MTLEFWGLFIMGMLGFCKLFGWAEDHEHEGLWAKRLSRFHLWLGFAFAGFIIWLAYESIVASLL